MTEETNGSTVPRRSLGLALESARKRAGFTMQQAADRVGVSVQTIRRVERGEVSTRPSLVEVLCEFYDIPKPMRDVLIGLAKESKSRGWWHSYGDVIPRWFELYVSLEQTARRIREFAPQLVPGLVQHSDYTGLVIRIDLPHLGDEEVSARIKLRQERQQLLTRSFPAPPEVEVIISEAVLLGEPTADGVMRSQVWHLLKATELPTVTLRVLPLRAGPHRSSASGGWTLMDFSSENGYNTPPSTVYSEDVTGAIYLDKPSEIETYEEVWAALDRAALDQTESIELMSQRLKELTDREA
ncbi:helix-turn-helix domain-containing protein [Actinoplanes sp. NPDC049668]|uniref:helix-turn-helix domain-containing protein n=1 Tax=unclassified Actinoplanes TaxID=2626549 RepID=UPI0033A1B556